MLFVELSNELSGSNEPVSILDHRGYLGPVKLLITAVEVYAQPV